jgi:hypothetical protein
MDGRFQDTQALREVPTVEYIHEGRLVAEVDVISIETDHEWSPYLSAADVRKLDTFRLALRRGDLNAALALARIYELTPVSAEEIA